MEEMIVEFKKLLEITEKLMGPEGCPWDREQTILSIRGSLVEEAYEMQDAIDQGDDRNLVEELGDVLFNVIFFCALGEKEKRFQGKDVVDAINSKLIERHPHVFGKNKLHDTEAVKEQWERIKYEKRESLLDGIPKALPALTKGYKIASKLKNAKFPQENLTLLDFESEEELGELLWKIIARAHAKGLHPEHALRDHLYRVESEFRAWERKDCL